jgi:H+/Cl- antiporter ClcA
MQEHRSLFAALTIVVLAALVAALLFVAAIVVWLAGIMGSIFYPCLIVGALFAIVATMIYKVSLRQTIRQTEEELGVVYDVAKMVNSTLHRLFTFVDSILSIREK